MNELSELEAPQDRFNFVHAGMFLLGLGSTLPFNFFITANSYFDYKLRNVTDPSAVTSLQSSYENYVSIASWIPYMIFSLINTTCTQRVSKSKPIVGSLLVTILIFGFTTAMVRINSDAWQPLFFIATMVSVVLISAISSVFQSGVYGLGNMLPPLYMQSIFSGQALGGVFATSASILSLAMGTSSIDSATGYFATAAGILLFSLGVYVSLTKTIFFQYYVTKGNASRLAVVDVDERKYQINSDHDVNSDVITEIPTPSRPSVSVFQVLKKCRLYAACACLVFLTTLTVYPAITAQVQSVDMDDDSIWTNKYFSSLCCFLVYSAGDFTSRLVASWLPWPPPDSVLLPLLCVLRLGFIPLLMLCNVQPRRHLPVVFDSDVYFVAFMLALAFSNGFLGSLCLVYGAKSVSEHEQKTAGTMMAFFLMLGLSLGSALSFAATAIV